MSEQNISKLKDLTPEDQHIVIRAIDCTKDKLDLAMPTSKANTGGLVAELHVAVGAKMMLTVNVDVSDGFMNGTRGTGEAIIRWHQDVMQYLLLLGVACIKVYRVILCMKVCCVILLYVCLLFIIYTCM